MAFDPTTARPLNPAAVTRPKSSFDPSTAVPLAIAAIRRPDAPPAPPEAPGFAGSFAQGFKRTIPQTTELLGAAQIAAGKLVGSDSFAQGGIDRFQEAQKETEQLAGPSFADVRSGKAGVGQYVGDVIGNFGGQAVQSAVAGLVGAGIGAATGSAVPVAGTAAGAITGAAAGLIGRKAAMAFARDMAEKYIVEQVGKGVAKDVAEAGAAQIIKRAGVGQAAKIGAVSAPFAINAGQEIGSAVENRIQDGTAPQDITRAQAAQAIGFGTVAGAVDTASEAFGLKQLAKIVRPGAVLKERGVLGRVATEALEGMVREGGTEVAQSALERAGGGSSLTDEAARNDYVESGVAGALGGVVLGAPAGIRRPKFEGAKPGSLADAANAVDEHAPVVSTSPSTPQVTRPGVQAGAPTAPPAQAQNPDQELQAATIPGKPPVDTLTPEATAAAKEQRARDMASVLPAPWVNTETGEFGLPKTRTELINHLASQIQSQQAAGKSLRVDSSLLGEAWGVSPKAIKSAKASALELLAERDKTAAAEQRALVRDQEQAGLEKIIRKPKPEDNSASSPVATSQDDQRNAESQQRSPEFGSAKSQSQSQDQTAQATPDQASESQTDAANGREAAQNTSDPTGAPAAASLDQSTAVDQGIGSSTDQSAAVASQEPKASPSPQDTPAQTEIKATTNAADLAQPTIGSGAQALPRNQEGQPAPGVSQEPAAADQSAAIPAESTSTGKGAEISGEGGGVRSGVPAGDIRTAQIKRLEDKAASGTLDKAGKAELANLQAAQTAAPSVAKGEPVPTDANQLRRSIKNDDRINPEHVKALVGDKPVGGRKALEALSTLAGDGIGFDAADLAKIPSKVIGKAKKYDPIELARYVRTKPEKASTEQVTSDGRTNSKEATRTEQHADVQAVAERKGSNQQPEQPVLPQLRGQGDNSASGVGSELQRVPAGDPASAEPETHAGKKGQRSGVRAGQSVLGDEAGAGQQSAQERESDGGRQDAIAGRVGARNGNDAERAALPENSGLDGRANSSNTEPDSQGSQARAGTESDGTVLDAAAAEAATSPENNLPEPTLAQHEANNFKQGHVKLHGLDITIQVPKGAMRRGTDSKGNAWERPSSDHYGHIRGTESADGEQVDVWLGPDAEKPAAKVFVIKQLKPGSQKFDENKAMVGFPNGRAARKSYDANFPKGLKTFGGITPMSIDQFKEWVKTAAAKKPASQADIGIPTSEQKQPVAAQDPKRDLILDAPADAKPAPIADPKPGETWFHGRMDEGNERAFLASRPAFFARDKKSAEWFAQGDGAITSHTIETKNTAHWRDFETTLRELGYDTTSEDSKLESDITKHSPYEGTNTIDAIYIPAVQKAMEAKGFDSLIVHDTIENTSTEALIVWKPEQIKQETVEPKAPDKIEDVGEKIGGARKDTAGTVRAGPKKEKSDTPGWQNRYIAMQSTASGKWGLFDQRKKDARGNARSLRQEFDTEQEAIDVIALAEVGRNHRVVQMRAAEGQEPRFEIVRDVTDRKRVRVLDKDFASRLEAMQYMAEHAVELIETKTSFGEEILPRPDKVRRTGEPRREGDVTGQQLMDTFGFRGVEFGNWNAQDERQTVMNHAFDGLADLADVLGIPQRAIGLNGELALAFGARGHGLSGARAHYESDYGAINLTKMKGAGALAHEWFHALDHYLGRQDGKAKSNRVENKRGDKTFERTTGDDLFVSGGFSRDSKVRAELKSAYADVIDTMMTKAVEYVEQTENSEKFVEQTKSDLAQTLQSTRDHLAAQLDTRYYKRKNAPATPEQLAQFDAIAEQLIAGQGLETSLREKPGAKTFTGVQWTNDAIDQLSGLYKAVRGRSGIDSTNGNGAIDKIRYAMGNYSRRLKLLAEAQAGDTKVRRVPTDFKLGATGADQGRASDYWTTPHEMAARAFEAYANDKIKESGAQSDFLTYGTHGRVPTPWGFLQVYPEGEERVAINAAFDRFTAVLESRTDDENKTALFRLPEKATTPNTSDAHTLSIAKAVFEVKKNWGPNQPTVRVLRSAEDLPASVKASPRYGEAHGVYLRGSKAVYLIAPNLRDVNDALATLAHEVIGHHGVESILDQQKEGAWDKLTADFDRLFKNPQLASASIQDVIKSVNLRYPGADATTKAKEAIAIMAERGLRNGLIGRVIAAVRAYLRKIMPSMRFNDAEIRSLLQKSEDFLKAGKQELDTRRAMVAAMNFSHADPLDSAPFKQFFEGSKVVKKDGSPKPLYHGTAEGFTVFETEHAGRNTGHMSAPLGHFFAEDRAKAEAYAEKASDGVPADERVIEVYAAIRNPKPMTVDQMMEIDSQEDARAMRADLIKQGYDGIHLANIGQWVAFQSGQVKSVENRGTFDASNPDINFSLPEDRQVRSQGIPASTGDPVSLWRSDKPLKRDVDYTAAKAGDAEAAIRLVDRNASTLVDLAKARFGDDVTYVTPHAQEATGPNAIPGALAEMLAARAGGLADRDIVQTNRAFHTGADAMQRMLARSTFDGPVEAGRKYVLVDDVTTMGGTLADLAHFIQANGGEVAGTLALVNAARSGKIAAPAALTRQLERRYGDEIRSQFNVDPAALTAEEAQYLIGFRSADELRNRAAKAEQARAERISSKGVRQEVAPSAPDESRQSESNTDHPALFSMPAQSVDVAESALKDPDAGAFARAMNWVKGKGEDLKPTALGALQMRHVLELAEGHEALRGSRQFAEDIQAMSTDRQMQMVGSPDFAENPNNMLMKGVAPIAEEWAKSERAPGLAGWLGKKNPEAARLTDVMHEATKEGMDPSTEYQRLTLRTSRDEQVPWTEALRKERIKGIIGQMRGRPGDDKTEMMAEVAYLRALPKREKARLKAWPALVAKYQALSPQAKTIYQQVRDWYSQHRQAEQDALMERIDAMELPKQQKRYMKEQMRLQFESSEVSVYFPLDRNGEFYISAIDGSGEQIYEMFESAGEFAKRQKQLLREGADIQASGRKDMEYRAKDAPSGTFIAEIMKPLIEARVSDKIMDDIYQVFLKTLPEMSMRKRNVHRKQTAGHSENAMRAFAKNGFHGAHQLAKLRFGHKLEAIKAAMQKSMDNYRQVHRLGSPDPKPFDVTTGDALLGEIKRRLDWVMDPKDSNLANKATAIGFFWYLGASPAAALVNLTQGAQVTLPVLGAHYDWPKAMRALGKATVDSMRTGGNILKTLTSDEERMAYRVMEKRGDFDRTQQHTLAGLAEGNELRSNPAWAKTMNVIGYLFHKAEVVNREAAGMAAFRMARAGGGIGRYATPMTFEQATQYASDIINGTHFDYSSQNRPRFMQGNVAKILLQFKNYSVGMTWMLGRNLRQAVKGEDAETRRLARRTLTGIMGMTSLLAGATGLPIINLVKLAANAAHAAFGDDDDGWDFETEFRSWLAEHFGGEVSSLIADGAVNKLGIDVADRVSLSNLWFRSADRELEGRDAYYQMLESIAGPMGGLVKNFYVGQQQITDGKLWRGVETMLPKFTKDAMKAVRYEHEGVNSLRGDPIVKDVGPGETLAQAIGFRPTRIAEQQRLNSALMNYQQHVKDRRATLLNAFAMTIQQNSPEGRASVIQKIQAFNKSYPEIAISTKTIRQSLQRRASFSEKAENGIVLDRRLASRIKREVGVDGGDGTQASDR